jgi:16S rRNA (uracil1498-N3)-methyltransferase
MHGKILSFEKKAKIEISLYMALQKMNDRFELFLEKATEIKIEITPIICDRSSEK